MEPKGISYDAYVMLCEEVCPECVHYDDINGCSPDLCMFCVHARVVGRAYDLYQQALDDMMNSCTKSDEELRPLDD